MGSVLRLHARFAGSHFERHGLHFGAQWITHFTPEDVLEFSEYARAPRSAWFIVCLALGSLMWLAIAAAVIG